MKLKAFTILDMLVGMIISSITMALAIESYFSMNRAVTANEINRNAAMSFSIARNILVYDAELADSIIQVKNEIFFYCGNRSIVWSNNEDRIIRQSSDMPDTLEISGKIEVTDTTASLVREVELTEKAGRIYRFRKDYASFFLK